MKTEAFFDRFPVFSLEQAGRAFGSRTRSSSTCCWNFREEELSEIEGLKKRLTAMWRREEWFVLTPPPDHAAVDFQRGERLFGRLCAAILRSWDDFFPTPYRDERGESPADFSEACVIYAVGRSEGLFPERLRNPIAWEDVARARIV